MKLARYPTTRRPADRIKVLKRTTSRCMVCHRAAPAEVYARGGQVWMRRTCAEHGTAEALISSDERFYHLSSGAGSCGAACACNTEADAATAKASSDPFDVLSTCLALIEIVQSCNLACPACYADSPHAREVDAITFDDFRARVEGVIARKGLIDILQLSGGEPTLHPRFMELLDWAQSHQGIGYVLINTNGVRLASDPAFAAGLQEVIRPGKVQLYLQFDGTRAEGQLELRGGDLREMKRRAIEAAGEIQGGLAVTLAMTVSPLNLPQLWETIEFGLQFPHVRGVAFQPMFFSGRTPQRVDLGARRLNTADIILGAVEQSGGKLRCEDFTPLPCGDPNCATIGYLLKLEGGTRSISEFIDFSKLQGFLGDRLNYNLKDLAQCGCESEPLGALMKQFELKESQTFRLFIKPFMDSTTWDQDRIDRCCTHVIRPDGKLDSFCRYYGVQS